MTKSKKSLTARIEIRCSEDLKNRLNQVAEIQGRSISDFVVEAASEKANQFIMEHQVISLTLKQSKAFAEALTNPPAPNEYLMESGRLYKQTSKE